MGQEEDKHAQLVDDVRDTAVSVTAQSLLVLLAVSTWAVRPVFKWRGLMGQKWRGTEET